MKTIYRILGLVLSICFVVLVVLFSIGVIRRTTGAALQRNSPRIAVLPLSGAIYSSSDFLRQLEEYESDSAIKGLVVRINSPGGLVGPSQEIYRAIRRADAKIPVVISMGSLAASGGYYAALGGRKIFSNPGTLTASIGVIMELPNFEGLMTWAKVQHYTIKAGKFKDVGNPFRKMLPEEQALLQAMLKDVHDQFKDAVAERRKIKKEDLENVADGRVMTGQQALAAKLVDALGGIDEAIAETKKMAKVPDTAEVQYPDSRGGFLKKLLWGDDESSTEERTSSLIQTSLTAVSRKLSPGAFRVLLMSPVMD